MTNPITFGQGLRYALARGLRPCASGVRQARRQMAQTSMYDTPATLAHALRGPRSHRALCWLSDYLADDALPFLSDHYIYHALTPIMDLRNIPAVEDYRGDLHRIHALGAYDPAYGGFRGWIDSNAALRRRWFVWAMFPGSAWRYRPSTEQAVLMPVLNDMAHALFGFFATITPMTDEEIDTYLASLDV